MSIFLKLMVETRWFKESPTIYWEILRAGNLPDNQDKTGITPDITEYICDHCGRDMDKPIRGYIQGSCPFSSYS